MSVTRAVQTHAGHLCEHPEEAWAEIVRRLTMERSFRGGFAAVHVCPDGMGAVPDSEEARPVILHPQHIHACCNTPPPRCGSAAATVRT